MTKYSEYTCPVISYRIYRTSRSAYESDHVLQRGDFMGRQEIAFQSLISELYGGIIGFPVRA